MLTEDYIRIFIIDTTDKLNSTKIAVRYPQIIRIDCWQDCGQQGTLLRMTIFTWEYIHWDPQYRIKHHKQLPGQWSSGKRTQFLDTVFGSLYAVAVDQPDVVSG